MPIFLLFNNCIEFLIQSQLICKTVVIYAPSLDGLWRIHFLSWRFHPKAPASVLTSFCEGFVIRLGKYLKITISLDLMWLSYALLVFKFSYMAAFWELFLDAYVSRFCWRNLKSERFNFLLEERLIIPLGKFCTSPVILWRKVQLTFMLKLVLQIIISS